MPRLTPDDLARWRRALYAGDQLDAATARRLMDEIDALWADLARQRVDIATKAAAALEERLEAVATYNSGGCSKCRDAEARVFLAKLKRITNVTSMLSRMAKASSTNRLHQAVGAAVGGMLFGPAGFLLRGLSATETTRDVVTSPELRLIVDDPGCSATSIHFFGIRLPVLIPLPVLIRLARSSTGTRRFALRWRENRGRPWLRSKSPLQRYRAAQKSPLSLSAWRR